MRTICLTVNAVATLLLVNVAVYMDHRSVLTWAICVVLGFLMVFPVDYHRRLYRLILDKRPQPREWSTAVLADPQDGYPEKSEWRLIGTVVERR